MIDISRSIWATVALLLLLVPTQVHAGITAPAYSDDDYTVSWTPVSPPPQLGYRLHESTNGGTTFPVWWDTTSPHSFTGKTPNDYTYDVSKCWWMGPPFNFKMCLPIGYSYATTEVIGTPTLSAPSEVFEGEVELTWSAVTNAADYKVQEKIDGTWTTLHSGVTGTSKTLTSLSPGTHYYRVRGCNSGTCADPSNFRQVDAEDLAHLDAPPTIGATDAAGSVPFSTHVSRKGDARITIPLELPPGPGGLQPRMAIAYSSGGGRELADSKKFVGTLGYGWSLAGLSQMQRCRVGLDDDPIDLSTDRVCLDGQALVKVAGSSYWADNAEYRTEKQTFVRVYARGTGVSGRWFEVHLPNGHVREYGKTAGSAVSPVGSSTLAIWGMNQETDDFGNALTIAWEDNVLRGTNYPTSITYGDADLEFYYELRDDAEAVGVGVGYGGGTFRRKVALHRIDVKMDATLVREYRLELAESANDQLRVERIQLCGYPEGGGTSACLAPLAMGWATSAIPEFDEVVETITDGYGKDHTFTCFALEGDDANHGRNFTLSNSYWGTFPSTLPSYLEKRDNVDRIAVESLEQPDGSGTNRKLMYSYQGVPLYGKDDGRGFLGFPAFRVEEEVLVYDPTTETSVAKSGRVDRQYRLDFPFIGVLAKDERRQTTADDVDHLLSRSMVGWETQSQHAGAVDFPHRAHAHRRELVITSSGSDVSHAAQSTEYAYCYIDLTGTTCPGSGTANEYPTQIVAETEFGTSLTTISNGSTWGDFQDRDVTSGAAYESGTVDLGNEDSTGYWTLGFVDREERGFGVSSATESFESVFTKHSLQSPEVKTATLYDGDTDYELTVNSLRNAAGNVDDTTTSGVGVSSRTATATSFLHDLYPQAVTNEEGHETDLAYDVRFGTVDSVTDPNNNVSTIERDEFGRITQIGQPDGTDINFTYESCDDVPTDCATVTWADAVLRISRTTSNGGQSAPEVRQYLDAAGRGVLLETEAFSSGWNRVEIHYDGMGRVTKRSLPYASGETAQLVEYHYGPFGRVVREDRPDGSSLTREYEGDVGWEGRTTTDSESGHAVWVKFDNRNLLVETKEGYGSAEEVSTTYTYDHRGQLDTVTVDGTEVADLDYDIAGNRTQIDEASSGVTTFVFDALHQVLHTTDANGDKTRFTYDKLGRLTERIDGYLGPDAITNDFTWDLATNGIGLLESQSNADFDETYTYDTTSRLDTITATVSVTGFSDNGPYVIDYDYDAKGRVSSVEYPSSQQFDYVYNTRGYLESIKKGSTTLTAIHAMDAFGNVTDEDFANGLQTLREYYADTGRLKSIETGTSATPQSVQDLLYTWNANGTLDKRTDQLGTATTTDDLVDTFAYDALVRLVGATTGLPNRVKTYAYDDFGNLTTKTSNISGDLDVTSYTYGTSMEPHVLTSVTIGGISNTLTYDYNGNVVEYDAASGDDTFIAYDAASRAIEITVGTSAGTSTPTARDEFWYGPNHDRFLRKSTWDDGGTQKVSWTFYLQGGVFEEVTPEHDAAIDFIQKVQVTETVLNRVVDKSDGTAPESVDYMHRDHLGSVEVITDSSGTVLFDFASDPFGGRRKANWSADVAASAIPGLADALEAYSTRGFTDHEELHRTGIIHMNGRIYDPRLGRFLQPDPVVQFPESGQNHNRYSYVFNDPLSWTDPSGFISCGIDDGWCLTTQLNALPSDLTDLHFGEALRKTSEEGGELADPGTDGDRGEDGTHSTFTQEVQEQEGRKGEYTVTLHNPKRGRRPRISPFDRTPDVNLGPGYGLIPSVFNCGGKFCEQSVNSAAVVALPLTFAAAPAVVGATVQTVSRGIQLTRAGVLAGDRLVKVSAATNPNAFSFGAGFTKGFTESFNPGTKGLLSPVTPGIPRSAQVGEKIGHIIGQAGGILFRAGLLPGQ